MKGGCTKLGKMARQSESGCYGIEIDLATPVNRDKNPDLK